MMAYWLDAGAAYPNVEAAKAALREKGLSPSAFTIWEVTAEDVRLAIKAALGILHANEVWIIKGADK